MTSTMRISRESPQFGKATRTGEQMRGNDHFYIRCWYEKCRLVKIGHRVKMQTQKFEHARDKKASQQQPSNQ